MSRAVILAFARYCVPGYKAGGPVRSLANLAARLGHEFDFRIVCSDRDLGDTSPYPGLPVNTWLDVGPMHVRYLDPASRNLSAIRALMRATPHDLLYLNSYFDPVFAGYPLLARFLERGGKPLLIAPRGEFSPSALRFKRWKKQPYLWALQHCGLTTAARWHASGAHEAEDIHAAAGVAMSRIHLAPNVSALPAVDTPCVPRTHGSALRVLFLSRISPMKNLLFALRVLARINTPVRFTICGPVGDEAYWRTCRTAMTSMPSHVTLDVRGALPPQEVASEMARHDLFFLPTLGENYGHAIAEALAVGTPVLISDRTPWRDLARSELGNDLPLDDEDAFVRVIEDCARLDPVSHARWRERIRATALDRLGDGAIVQANRAMLLSALGGNP